MSLFPISGAKDYLLWDAPEPVVVQTFYLPGQPNTLPVPIAVRAQVKAAEREPTGGVYAGYDVDWLLPGALLGDDPKPGTLITDERFTHPDTNQPTGTTWTVLNNEWEVYDAGWRCYCVNLVLAYGLRDAVDVQRATLTYDATGAAVRAWPDNNRPGISVAGSVPYAAVPCRAQLMSQDEARERGLRGMAGAYHVVVFSQMTLTAEDRLKVTFADTTKGVLYLDVKAQTQPNRIDELPVLTCEQAP